jgi:type I restriction enzyme S subunit
MPRDMSNGRVDRSTVKRIREETASRLQAHRLSQGDLVLARRGDIGRLASIAADEEGWVCGTGSMRIHAPNHDVLDPGFLRYAMSAPAVGEWLEGQAVGATMPNLNAEVVSAVPLQIPSIETQRRIAAACSAFDRLIAINERRIGLLEDLARSLYREWFVHFRFPGHTRGVKAGRASTPEGWPAHKLGELIEINGDTIKASELPDPVEYLDISSVGSGKLESTKSMGAADVPSRARRRVADGDVVWSTVRPDRRAHSVIHEPASNLIASTGLAVLSPVRVPSSFLFEYASSGAFSSYLAGRATGSAYPAVRPKDFAAAPVMVPPKGLLDQFDSVVDPMLRLRTALQRQCAEFIFSRDLLLPRLVTGQLDISDIDLGVLTPKVPE